MRLIHSAQKPINTTDDKKEGSFWSEKEASQNKGFLPSIKQLKYLPRVLSKKERYLTLVLCLLILGSIISLPFTIYNHFTDATPDFGGMMIEGLIGSPRYINPVLAQSNDTDRDISNLIYSGLLKYDEDGKLITNLAESYSISQDQLSYTFKLKDARWHDEEPITANDVIFTVTTIQNADYGSPQRINWQGVEVNKIDDKTVIFKLKNKYGQFLNNMTLGIIPEHAWLNIKPANFALSELNTKPIGSGPYKFSSLRKDNSGQIDTYRLTAFDEYYDGRPNIDDVTFRFYNSEESMIDGYNNGDIDSMSFVSADKLKLIRFRSKLDIKHINLPRYFAAFFNPNKNEILNDKNVRIALNQATNKQAIIDKVLNGNGKSIDSPTIPEILSLPLSKKKYEFNLEEAKKTLRSAGWQYSEEEKIFIIPNKAKANQPKKLEIELTTSEWPELLSVASELKTQWEKIGVRVNIKALPVSELQQTIRERDYEALLFGEVLNVDPDPFSFWHSSQRRDPGINLSLFDNKNADKILEDARQIIDGETRKQKYAEFQEIVIAEAPVVFLYSSDYIYPQSKSIKGNNTHLISSPANRFDTITKWYIKTKRTF